MLTQVAKIFRSRPTLPDPELKKLHNPYQFTRDQMVEMVAQHTREEIEEMFVDDPFLRNFAVNHWEYVNGVTNLTSYPWNVVVPISDACNASCSFCDSWLRGKRTLKVEEVERFAPVLKYAAMLGLEGHGEPLIHPRFNEIVTQLKDLVDLRCRSYIITNGFKLEEFLDDLMAIGVNIYNISLNAATAETHHKVMALGETAFDKVVGAIRRLRAIQEAGTFRHPMAINVSMVVTSENLHEVPAFVELCNKLEVSLVNLRTLLPQKYLHAGLNYHVLPPYRRSDFAEHVERSRSAIAASKVPVNVDLEQWGKPVFSPEVEADLQQNPRPIRPRHELKIVYQETCAESDVLKKLATVTTRGEKQTETPVWPWNPPERENEAFRRDARQAPYQCWDVYAILHLNDFFFMLRPCCYLEITPGYEWTKFDGTYDFMEAWNSPSMVELRRRLKEGKLFTMCTLCPEQKQYKIEP